MAQFNYINVSVIILCRDTHGKKKNRASITYSDDENKPYVR